MNNFSYNITRALWYIFNCEGDCLIFNAHVRDFAEILLRLWEIPDKISTKDILRLRKFTIQDIQVLLCYYIIDLMIKLIKVSYQDGNALYAILIKILLT